MSYDDAFGLLINAVAYAAGPILGFVSGWALFILQEDRKEMRAAKSAMQSLLVS